MSRFRQSFQGIVAAAHRHQFASPVLLNQAGTVTTTPAVLHTIKTDTRLVDGDTQRVSTWRCRFTDITSIRHDAITTIDSNDWTIDAVHSEGPSGVEVTLIRLQIHEQARDRYRK